MTKLNEDCWRLILHELDTDPLTLFNLLLVSRQLFLLSVPILYAHPFTLPRTQHLGTISDFSDLRLRYLIDLCSGFYRYSKQEKPRWPNPAQLPTTINYASLVKALPPYSEVGRGFALEYCECNCAKITELTIEVASLEKIFHLATRFKQLTTLYPRIPVRGALMRERDAATVVRFVKAHVAKFPGLLKTVSRSHDWGDIKTYLSFQEALGTQIEYMEITADPEDGLTLLPTTGIKRLKIFTGSSRNRQSDEVEVYLPKCRELQVLQASHVPPTTFRWAVLEQERYQKEQELIQQRAQQSRLYPLQQPQQQPQSELEPLVPLKDIIVTGAREVLSDILIGFQQTLERVIYNYPYTASNDTAVRRIQFEFQLPRLTSLSVHRCAINFECLENCPVLEELSVTADLRHRHECKKWKAPTTLKKLVLTTMAAVSLDLNSLKELKRLETLDMQCSGSPRLKEDERVLGEMTLINVEGWNFPCLKSVIMSGPPADAIQGLLLGVAPVLESYRIELSTQKNNVDLNTFFAVLQTPTNTDIKETEGKDNGMKKEPVKSSSGQGKEDISQRLNGKAPVKMIVQGPTEYPFLRTLSIRNMHVDGLNLKLLEDLMSVIQQDLSTLSTTTTTSSTSLPPRFRHMTHFPALRQLTLSFFLSHVPKLRDMVLQLMQVPNMSTITIGGTSVNNSAKLLKTGGSKIAAVFEPRYMKELEMIEDFDTMVTNPKLYKKCICIAETNYCRYWMPSSTVAASSALTTTITANGQQTKSEPEVPSPVPVSKSPKSTLAFGLGSQNSKRASTISTSSSTTGSSLRNRVLDWVGRK